VSFVAFPLVSPKYDLEVDTVASKDGSIVNIKMTGRRRFRIMTDTVGAATGTIPVSISFNRHGVVVSADCRVRTVVKAITSAGRNKVKLDVRQDGDGYVIWILVPTDAMVRESRTTVQTSVNEINVPDLLDDELEALHREAAAYTPQPSANGHHGSPTATAQPSSNGNGHHPQPTEPKAETRKKKAGKQKLSKKERRRTMRAERRRQTVQS